MKNLYNNRLYIALVVLFLSIFISLGIIYDIGIINNQILFLLSKILIEFSIFSIIFLGIILLVTIFFGRIHCSIFCPFGILEEILGLLFNNNSKPKKNHVFKYFITFICFGVFFSGSSYLIRYINPTFLFNSILNLSIFGIVVFLLISILVLYKGRFFCVNICPMGIILGLISKFSIFKIKVNSSCKKCLKCIQKCPTNSIYFEDNIVKINNETCIRCFRCTNECENNALEFKKEIKKEIKFNPKRRDFIYAGTLSAVFIGAYFSGIKLAKKLQEKITNIILPPGAIKKKDFINKCLNCNLCIKNCPNKIIQPMDDKHDTIYIDYKKSNNYCKYNCIECSKVCPIGAIKKITLEEKQETKIAHAQINVQKCSKCNYCITICPKMAIKENNDKIEIDNSKCIGCGKCLIVCPNYAIKISSIENEK